jgi:DNA-binding NarL/FixJ family response regulator
MRWVIGKGLMGAGPIRLVLAGTDVRMRERVRAVIATRPQLLLVRDVTGGEEAIAAVAALAPDVLVLDMEITGIHAFSVTRTVLALRPQLGIAVWIDLYDSSKLPDWKASSMQRAGACCCVDDAADPAELEQALVCAAAGKEAFLSHRLTLRATLTGREHELLALLAAGWTTAQIARKIKIAPATVYTHTARICRKLGLAGHAEVAEAGRNLGLGRDMDVTTDLDANYRAYHAKREEFYRARSASGL